MKDKLKALLNLHVIDQEILALKNSSEEIPMRQNMLKAEKAIIENQLDDLKSNIKEAEKDRRDTEGELQLETEKIKQRQSRLHEIKTNKEYHAALKEIDLANKANSEREEKILQLMEQIENKQSELQAKEQEFQPKFDEIEAENKELASELAQVASKIEEKQKGREKAVGEVDSAILKVYENIRKHRPAPAMVSVNGFICQACHMNIPPQQVIELKKYSSLLTCPSCQRILYWAEEEKIDAEAK